MPPRFPKRRLLEAIKRVQVVNHKLIEFERGFISKEGVKDREWYKHLGVAPGKWLGELHSAQCALPRSLMGLSGYGATTFPGITEAITMDEDALAASREVERLRLLIDGLTERISV